MQDIETKPGSFIDVKLVITALIGKVGPDALADFIFLVKEYIDLLNGEENASDKFWKLEERIKRDSKNSGVLIELRKSGFYSQ